MVRDALRRAALLTMRAGGFRASDIVAIAQSNAVCPPISAVRVAVAAGLIGVKLRDGSGCGLRPKKWIIHNETFKAVGNLADNRTGHQCGLGAELSRKADQDHRLDLARRRDRHHGADSRPLYLCQDRTA